MHLILSTNVLATDYENIKTESNHEESEPDNEDTNQDYQEYDDYTYDKQRPQSETRSLQKLNHEDIFYYLDVIKSKNNNF